MGNQMPGGVGNDGPQGSPRDERLYANNQGLMPPGMLGDDLSGDDGWERNSHRSGRSQMS